MSTLMSMLSVQGERRSRSKSPSGRDRERSRSNTREEKTESRRERRPSKKHSDSGSENEGDSRRQSERRSSKKYYESDSEEDVRKYRTSQKYDTVTAEDYTRKSISKQTSRRKSDSDSDSDSEDDRRRSRHGSAVPNIMTVTPESFAAASKVVSPTSASYGQGKVKSPIQVQPTYGQANAYSYAPPPGHVPQPPGAFPEHPHGALSQTRHMSYVSQDPRYAAPQPDYRQRTGSSTGPSGQQYAQVGNFQYAQIDPKIAYKDPNSSMNVYNAQPKPQVVSVDPRRSDSKITDKKYVDDKYKSRDHEREKRYTEDKYKVQERQPERYERKESKVVVNDDKSAARRLSRLSIGGAAGAATLGVAVAGAHGASNGDRPPPSPLLEAYTGTYQSISPMPSALVLAKHKNDSDISDVELDSDDSDLSDDPAAERKRMIKRLEKEKEWIQKKREKEVGEPKEYERRRPSTSSHHQYETRTPDDDIASSIASPRSSRTKKVSFYDASADAKEIAAALKGSKPPNVKTIIRILPHLTPDDLDALRIEYKNHATIGGQGINMSKHIKARLTGHLGKAAYATSLGQYESDAYWANCFYQSGASRRELLIESLMGRTNQQIREVKNFFKDKKYDDDLEKCLKAELKADKFRKAILLALEERRQAETPILDAKLVKNDVLDLYDALHSPGGESAMIEIIVVRSDAHLREVLRQYEKRYDQNFAREMISKSRNLVGETLAHILNGALNRSMRDALLIHQAIAETAPGKERAELLMSRLVRLHWEPKHMEKVKAQYYQRYGIKIDDAIRMDIQAHMKTEEGLAWTNFCIELLRSSEQ